MSVELHGGHFTDEEENSDSRLRQFLRSSWTKARGGEAKRRLDDESLALESGRRPRSRFIPILLSVVALNAFGTVIWYAYNWGKGSLDDSALPVVTADGDPIKVRPAEEGGLVILHQDKLVLNTGLESPESQVVEHLLAPPEVPQELAFSRAKEEGGEIATLGHQLQASKPSPDVAVLIVEAEEVIPPSAPAPAPKISAPKITEAAIPAPESPEPAVAPAAKQLQSAQVPTDSGFVLQLAALQDAGAAKTEWARLRKAHPQLLGGLTVNYEKAVVGGKTYYRILTGPFPTRATVEDLCAQLKSKKQSCLVKKQAP
jgi:cell division septation protein DedD